MSRFKLVVLPVVAGLLASGVVFGCATVGDDAEHSADDVERAEQAAVSSHDSCIPRAGKTLYSFECTDRTSVVRCLGSRVTALAEKRRCENRGEAAIVQVCRHEPVMFGNIPFYCLPL